MKRNRTLIFKILGVKDKSNQPYITEEELKTMVNVSHEEGVLEIEERQIINNVFQFGDMQAKEAMVQRLDMIAINSEDKYEEIIKEKLSYDGAKVSAVFFFLKTEKGYTGSYSNLTYYVRNHPEIKNMTTKNETHVRFETKAGEQLQFDWIESITLISKYGEVF